jgi:DNA-binding LacI/PurR family transcriptional regulator
VVLAVDEIFHLGYSHTVVVLPTTLEKDRVGHRWRSGALIQREVHGAERVTVIEDDSSPAMMAKLVELTRQSGVAVLGISPLMQRLQAAGVRIPSTTGFAAFDLFPEMASVIQPHRTLGEQAASHLARLVERGQWGIPDLPCRITLECGWQPGKSLPKRQQPAVKVQK